jgi:hypothetical protein
MRFQKRTFRIIDLQVKLDATPLPQEHGSFLPILFFNFGVYLWSKHFFLLHNASIILKENRHKISGGLISYFIAVFSF